MAESILSASITEETRRRYLNYALSVIQSRALPDVRDGLKPVQRRILYTMYHDLGLRADTRPRKCAKIIGDVTGNYHPHGGSAAYEALVRMAQDFVLRMPVVDGIGNFGSVDGDSPAADRYTEARLTALAERLMNEMSRTSVPAVMRLNYDNTRQEPRVLPAQFPNLLVNGSSGIAVGMATNIPPHNLGEVIRACVLLIDEPEATTANLLDKIKGPDFPLGGKVVTDRPTLRKIYEEGTGSVKVQGEWKTETVSGGKQQIVITSVPFGVNKAQMVQAIGQIIVERSLPQVLEVTDLSSNDVGIRVVLELKKDSDPNLVMAYLYKHTALQENFAYNLTCLIPITDAEGNEVPKPERLGLKAILQHFLDFRFLTVKRRFEHDLAVLKKRIHILEGFAIIFDALDKAIKLIRESSGKADAAEKLIKAFKLDEIQADAILDAQLYKIAQMEILRIREELRDKKAEAERIEAILASNKKLWKVVRGEMEELAEAMADRRRTRMAAGEDVPDFDLEAYIVKENTDVVLTRDGWIKRVGKLASVEGTRVREGDEVIAVVLGNTLDHVVIFADDGTAYTMRINEVPASSGYGEPAAKFFRLADQVKILGACTTDERFIPAEKAANNGDPPPPYLLVVTAQGQVLRTPLAPFRTASTKAGRRYARLNDGDKVVTAIVLRGDEETIYLASADGRVLHFNIEEINILSGVGKGVMGIKLDDGDRCLGAALMSGRFDKFVLETSGGKTMEFGRNKYEVTSRAGKGYEAVKRANFVRVVPPPIDLVDWDAMEGKKDEKKKNGNNGNGAGLFE